MTGPLSAPDAGTGDPVAVTAVTPAGGSLLEQVLDRRPFGEHVGLSGAVLERGVLPDGTKVVLKHVSSAGSWLMHASRDPGREGLLFSAGLASSLPAVVDPAVLAVALVGDGWTIVMRDVSAALIPVGVRPTSRSDGRRILRAAIALHDAFNGAVPDGPSFSLLDRCSWHTLAAANDGPADPGPLAGWIRRGWELAPDHLPPDVLAVALALADDPGLLAAQLARCEQTLIHGDLRLVNVGLLADRVVMLDWSLCGIAPPAVELSWFLLHNTGFMAATPDHVADDIRLLAGDRVDQRSWDLAVIWWCLVGVPPLAMWASQELPWFPLPKAVELLEWFVRNVREALSRTWSPV